MIVGIDPGPEFTAVVRLHDDGKIEAHTFGTLFFARFHHPAQVLFDGDSTVGIERVASYGMAVGESIFATCYESGRMAERIESLTGRAILWVPRLDVKMYLCGQAKAKDANIRQALLDRYGSAREVAIGTKKTPGPLYGIRKDEWAALGVALTTKAKTEGWKR